MKSVLKRKPDMAREDYRQEIVRRLADLLLKDLEEHPLEAPEAPATPQETSPWLTIKEAATRLSCGTRPLYRAIAAKQLRATPINDRGDLRTRQDWIDEWLLSRKNF